MDLIDALRELGNVSLVRGKTLTNEEQTKHGLVLPFLQKMGYDVFNPAEVAPEYSAAMGVKKDARVDYAILKDGEPVILIECKAYGTPLDVSKCSQLMSYFHATPAHIGILTDGNRYQFFSDLVQPNKMDEKPYMELVLEDVKENLIPALKKLTKEGLNIDEWQEEALEMKYIREFKTIFAAQIVEPETEFIRFFASKVFDGHITQKQKDKFSPLLKKALTQYINDKINDRLASAIKNEDEKDGTSQEIVQPEQISNQEGDNPKGRAISTTQEEKEAYYIVKSIVREVIDPSLVSLVDRIDYCNILYSGKSTKPIARLRFNAATVKYFSTFDAEKNEIKNKINTLNDIFCYAEELKRIVQLYCQDKANLS